MTASGHNPWMINAPRATGPAHLARWAWQLTLGCAMAWPAHGHGVKVGDLIIDHPYAMPSPPGAVDGAAYLRLLSNTGDAPDRLIGARSPVAASVTFQRTRADGKTLTMSTPTAIDLPPHSQLPMRHDGEWRLRLVGLQAPLKPGDEFTLTLRFERAGEKDVPVTVQQPRSPGTAHRH
jgi:copper(I)-binding protein